MKGHLMEKNSPQSPRGDQWAQKYDPRKAYTTDYMKRFYWREWGHCILDTDGCAQLVGTVRALRTLEEEITELQQKRARFMNSLRHMGLMKKPLMRALWLWNSNHPDKTERARLTMHQPYDPLREGKKIRGKDSDFPREEMIELSELYWAIIQDYVAKQGDELHPPRSIKDEETESKS